LDTTTAPKIAFYAIRIYHKSDQADVDKETIAKAVHELVQAKLDMPEGQ
jgi:hypothetical protein